MARVTVDIELLIITLLTEALPGVTVMAAVDVDTVDLVPAVIVTPISGAMISNGSPSLGWSWLISLDILERPMQKASDLADLVYQTVHGFHDNQARVPGVGYVNSVDDDSMPKRTATIVTEDNLTQYQGSWTVVVRPEN